MALMFPSVERAKCSKQKPTAGEIHLLEFLEKSFGDEVEVYFQPCFNGDRPDVVLLSRTHGVVIIEVKDWNLGRYEVDSDNKWTVELARAPIKSPFKQVFNYKKTFFDIHVNGLLEKSLKNNKFFGIVKCFVYFHGSSKKSIDNLYISHIRDFKALSRENGEKFKAGEIDFAAYEKKEAWIDRKLRVFNRDMAMSIHEGNLNKIKFPLTGREMTFDESVYGEFKRLLSPPYHYATEGVLPTYSQAQAKLIKSVEKGRAKVCGLAGSGKTVVLAGRAVEAHKRHGGRVLILSFNITLQSYIHDKISAVREDFSWSSFDINSYHRFMMSALNNAGINVDVPKELNYEGSDRAVAREMSEKRDAYLEENYFSNLNVFDGDDVEVKYETVLVDEIQDFKPEWIKIIRSNFLEPDGEMVLFGDEKQNIYKRALDSERRAKVVEGFGTWVKLKKSYRYLAESPVLPLVDAFQKSFLLKNYEIDDDESFQLSLTSVGVQGFELFEPSNLEAVAERIIAISKKQGIHPNDISVISSHEGVLRELDYIFRNSPSHRERTITTFPSKEAVQHKAFGKEYRKIGVNKKKGFNLNSGVMKICSTHSFKGFESPYIVLLVNSSDSPEMVFTGLTRAKQNVLVFVEGSSQYVDFFERHLNELQVI